MIIVVLPTKRNSSSSRGTHRGAECADLCSFDQAGNRGRLAGDAASAREDRSNYYCRCDQGVHRRQYFEAFVPGARRSLIVLQILETFSLRIKERIVEVAQGVVGHFFEVPRMSNRALEPNSDAQGLQEQIQRTVDHIGEQTVEVVKGCSTMSR